MPNPPHLRAVSDSDLPIFFEQQLDPEAIYMAAFTAENPADRAAFDTHWAKIMADKSITIRTILLGDEVAGHDSAYANARGQDLDEVIMNLPAEK